MCKIFYQCTSIVQILLKKILREIKIENPKEIPLTKKRVFRVEAKPGNKHLLQLLNKKEFSNSSVSMIIS